MSRHPHHQHQPGHQGGYGGHPQYPPQQQQYHQQQQPPYGFAQPLLQPPMPPGYYPAQPAYHYQHQQHQHHQQHHQQQQYSQHQQHYGYGYEQQHQHQQHHYPAEHQQHQHHQEAAAEPVDSAALEAEIRAVVEAAFATPSLLRGAGSSGAAGSGGGGFHYHHKGGGKQKPQHQPLLTKLKAGAVPFDAVCGLPQVKRLAQGDRALVQRALEASEVLEVAGGGKQQRVGRRDLMAATGQAAELPYRCVALLRLPEDKASEAAVRALVAAYGEPGCVVVVGGPEDEEAEDGEATAAGRGPPSELKALVEFKEGTGAVKCVAALSGGSNWRRGLRAEFLSPGLTLAQAAKHFGVELASLATAAPAADGSGGEAGSGAAASASSSAMVSPAMSASALEARLPPTLPEGQHTGVVMELALALATLPAAAEGEEPKQVQVQRGVIKREGRVRSMISFECPATATATATGIAVGDRVDFVVKHVDNKAVVVSVQKSTAPPPAAAAAASGLGVRKGKDAAGGAGVGAGGKGGGGGAGGGPAFVQAKGPDEKGGLGFLMPRTKPGEEMRALLETLKTLKVK